MTPRRRGGPQLIPRPPETALGDPPPWAAIPESQRTFSMELLRGSLVELPEELVGSVESAKSASSSAASTESDNPGDPLAGQLESLRRAAVLVPLYADVATGQTHVILTRRAAHLRSHSWEVSFPGGGREDDDPSLWHTALREAQEEIALSPDSVEFIGHLPQFRTVGSRSLIQPQVAWLPKLEPDGLVPDPNEVEHILYVPITELLLDEVFREEVWDLPSIGQARVNFFELVGDTVWGATAAMLRQLLMLGTGTGSLQDSNHFWEQNRTRNS